MIVVHDDDGVVVDDDDGAQASQRRRTFRQRRQCGEEHAALCKSETYSLCMEIDSMLRASADGSLPVDRSVLSGWFARLKGANKSISRYVRAVAGERDRGDVETHMLKHAMQSDVLDRESAFTQTLEAIAAVDGVQQDKVARAMRFIASVNGSMSNLTPDNSPEGASSAECAEMRDDAGR